MQRLKGVSSESFGCENQLTHSVEKWHRFVRQAWLLGFLKRSLAVGSAHNRMSSIIYAAYTVTDIGVKLMTEDEVQEILLSSEMTVGLKIEVKSNAEVLSESVTHKGKGNHILNIAKELFWISKIGFLLTGQMITISLEFSLRLIFNDLGTVITYVSKLPNYEASDPHFLYSDI